MTKVRLKQLGEPISTQLRSTISRQLSNTPGTSSSSVVIMTKMSSSATSTSATWYSDGSSIVLLGTYRLQREDGTDVGNPGNIKHLHRFYP